LRTDVRPLHRPHPLSHSSSTAALLPQLFYRSRFATVVAGTVVAGTVVAGTVVAGTVVAGTATG
jgi:hypothetical protein